MSGVRKEKESEEDQRASRSLNVRVRGLVENEGEVLVKVLGSVFAQVGVSLLELNVEVLGRQGSTPTNRRHVLLGCPTPGAKQRLLDKDQELQELGTGLSIVEDRTRRERQGQSPRDDGRDRRVQLDGMVELYADDDMYLTEYFMDKMCDDDAEYDFLMQELEGVRRVGAFRGMGKKPRPLMLKFKSPQAKALLMSKKHKVMRTCYYLRE